ncbi:WD40 repeat domain-containing protein [bacterium]|nr:WD40 repeat domain-containing protein [bacterium]
MNSFKKWIFFLLVLSFPGGLEAQDFKPVATSDLALSNQGYPRLLFDPSGTRLTAALRKVGPKGRVVFLNVPDLEVIREVHTGAETGPEPQSISFSRGGDLFGISVAAEGENPMSFVVLSTTDWKQVYADREIKSPPTSICFDPVGDFLYVGNELSSGVNRFVVGPWSKEKIPPLDGIDSPCQALAVSPDGGFSAIGTTGGKLIVWPNDDSAAAMTLGSQQFQGAVGSVAFSADSQLLAGGDKAGNVMVFYRTQDGQWAWRSVFPIKGAGVNAVAFLKDGSLATASTDGLIARWNLDDTSQPVEKIQVEPQDAVALAVDPNGRWLAAGGERILIYPLGSSEPIPATEIPSAPFTIVQKSAPDQAPPVPSVATIQSATAPVLPAPSSEDHGNFLLWMALGSPDEDGQDWIQGWAGLLDDGRFDPLQLILQYNSLNKAVMQSNLKNIGKVLKKQDFNVLYASAVLAGTPENKSIPLAFGSDIKQAIPLGEFVDAIQASARIAPTVWFLDLRPSPGMTDEVASEIFRSVLLKVEMNDDRSKREPIGVGLMILSKDGAYPELAGSVRDALSGQADVDGDGRILDYEAVQFLSERCHTAARLQLIGVAQHTLPVLPQFKLTR